MEPQIIIPKGEPTAPSLDKPDVAEPNITQPSNPASNVVEPNIPNVESTTEPNGSDAPQEEFTQIEIDNIIYDLDKSGNAINTDGTIFKTVDQIKELEEAEPNVPSLTTISDIQQRINIIPTDDKGNPIVYSNDAEGIAKYTSDLLSLREQELRNSVKNEFFAENPEIAAAYNHKIKTGSLDGFTATPSWKHFDTTTASEQDLTNLIVAYRKSLGDDDTSINILIDSIKGSKKIVEYADNAKKQLVKKEEDDVAEAARQQKIIEDNEAKKVADYWKEVNNVITSGKIVLDDETVIIPEVMRRNESGVIKTYGKADFYKYVNELKPFKIDNETRMLTQYQYEQAIKINNRNVNHELIEALQMFVKNDTSQIIKRALKEERVNNIKRLGKKSGDSSTSSSETTAKIIIKRK